MPFRCVAYVLLSCRCDSLLVDRERGKAAFGLLHFVVRRQADAQKRLVRKLYRMGSVVQPGLTVVAELRGEDRSTALEFQPDIRIVCWKDCLTVWCLLRVDGKALAAHGIAILQLASAVVVAARAVVSKGDEKHVLALAILNVSENQQYYIKSLHNYLVVIVSRHEAFHL